MNLKRVCLATFAILGGLVIPVSAQEKLGDFISQYGYDSMIGKWAATDNEGRTYQLEYKWGLDKHVVLVNVKIDDFRYRGMIMYVPSRQEITQVGADNKGGTWNGTWDEDSEGAINRNTCLKADGTTLQVEHVYVKIDANSFKIKEYPVEAGGYRAAEPRGELTFKRQKISEAQKPKRNR
jgi:hypothetical protein